VGVARSGAAAAGVANARARARAPLTSFASSTTTGASRSSLTISATRFVCRSELQKISSDSTSSRFTASPVAFVEPSTP
jgi:hypothetical protein